MNNEVRTVVIVGGGTAGWITAGILAAYQKKHCAKPLKVKLIESPNVATIGVGEGTWPTLRNTLKEMGIRETDFIRECQATFKQGAKFSKWCTGEEDDFYYHPLVLPTGYHNINLAPHWPSLAQSSSFSNAVCEQESLCELMRAPKNISTPEYQGIANYSYHLDAGKFATFLQKHCVTQLGVEHIQDDVIKVNNDDEEFISSLSTQQHGLLEGDLFIDCSGAKALLLSQHYQIPFNSCHDTLFCDRAIAAQVPYSDDNSPIASNTISTATSAGWIWEIGLQNRKGIGHVYSSQHTTEDQALSELQLYLGQEVNDLSSLDYKQISFDPGYREKLWHKNCVAIGMSAGFVEPLEASSIVLAEISAKMIAEQMPRCREVMPIIEKRFNQTFTYRWQRIIDFLKLHYALSQRTDSQFWLDNQDPNTSPESLNELLALWKYQPPWHDDFDRAVEVFPSASYQYVLYGMGFKSHPNHSGHSTSAAELAAYHFNKTRQSSQQLLNQLPCHRELINKIHQFGLQTV
ncbi:MAG: tryptophan halogenase family protein [Paraglaciecola sp.]|uniref:tryptophan halogenase family protein n=1 Tax=Paraglaciecola sp. TaxID=1920173 RepID=UPI003296B72F